MTDGANGPLSKGLPRRQARDEAPGRLRRFVLVAARNVHAQESTAVRGNRCVE